MASAEARMSAGRDAVVDAVQSQDSVLHCAVQPDDRARAHNGIARLHHCLGDRERARHHWRRALDILTDLGLTHYEEVDADDIRERLART